MDNIELTVAFFRAIETRSWPTLGKLLSDDFRYFGPMPESFDKEVWLSFVEAIQEAFPDWAYHLKKVEGNGNTVKITLQITGTHTKPLTLPWKDVKTIPATHRKVHMPQEEATLKVRNGKVNELHVKFSHHGGLIGLLEQLGIE